jgi:hypothetical protein
MVPPLCKGRQGGVELAICHFVSIRRGLTSSCERSILRAESDPFFLSRGGSPATRHPLNYNVRDNVSIFEREFRVKGKTCET